MPVVNGYTDLATIKARLGIADTNDDTTLENLITAVSRFVDDYCGRRFYAATQTRYYSPRATMVLWVDDLVSVTTLKTDEDGDRVYEVTWAATDYDLMPFNAALEAQVEPYTHIGVSPDGRYSFPIIARGVEIVGSFGFASATPPVIREACLLQTARVWKRQDTPFGVQSSPDFGSMQVVPRLDPDVRMMLAPYRRLAVA